MNKMKEIQEVNQTLLNFANEIINTFENNLKDTKDTL